MVYATQFSSFSLGTREKCVMLLVTGVRFSARAAAMNMSIAPINFPCSSRKVRTQHMPERGCRRRLAVG